LRQISAVQLAHGETVQRVVPDHARRRDLAVDDDHAADDVLPGVQAGDDVEGLDTVLQAHDGGLAPDHGADRPRRGLHVEELRPEQYHLDRPRRRRIVGGRGRGDQHVAERAQDPEPVLADRRQMRAPGDEGHLGARRRQPRTDVAADGAGPHHRDPHAVAPPFRGCPVAGAAINGNRVGAPGDTCMPEVQCRD
jgi:hypothetical protein